MSPRFRITLVGVFGLGLYFSQVRVEAPGFQTFVQDNVGVSVDAEARVDIKLQVGEVSQTLEVTAKASGAARS